MTEDPLVDEAQFATHSGDASPTVGCPTVGCPIACSATELTVAAAEAQDRSRVPVQFVIRIVDAQLPAHPEMDENAQLGRLSEHRILPIGRARLWPAALPQAQPHELPAPFGTEDVRTVDGGDEAVDRGRVDAALGGRAEYSGVDHLGAGDRRPRRPFVDAAADAFDLGKLRHGNTVLSHADPQIAQRR